MGDMKVIKFEMFIESIQDAWDESMDSNLALALIYDYDSCNEYAKAIMRNSYIEYATAPDSILRKMQKDNSVYPGHVEEDLKLKVAKEFVSCVSDEDYDDPGRYKFIFWALMVLTVDKTNAEEHLALVCDFARMLRITEDEFEDIIDVVKMVYGERTNRSFKSDVYDVFVDVIDKFSE